jgi:sugar/nucleoside kinase (ribokinase family)
LQPIYWQQKKLRIFGFRWQWSLKICIDLASFNIVEDHKDFFLEIIKNYVDIVFANNQEAESISGAIPEEAAVILGELAEIVIVKLGAEGSLIRSNNQTLRVGVRPSNPIDTTGAGDLYASGFLYGLIHGMPLEKCGQIGAILSGKVIEINGAKMDEASWETLRREIKAITS